MEKAEGYAGDIFPKDAWKKLVDDPGALLVDVRTRAEWSFVGCPDLTDIEKPLIMIEWQIFPEMEVNEDFQQDLDLAVKKTGAGQDATLIMICRSGVRSRSAAQAMTALGYDHCYNVATGFEGDLDKTGKRGRGGGWKVDGLPWRQG